MYEFKDLTGVTTVATIAVGAYAFTDVFSTLALIIQGPGDETSFRAAEALLILNFVVLIACLIIVGRWIYRASTNAHAMHSEMTISPGWAVGWYFVPFANLIKPLHAMREVWWASHESSGGYEENVPILTIWWTLWITSNVAANIAYRFEPIEPALNLIATALTLPLCFVLIRIMRDVAQSQNATRHEVTFA